MPIYTIKNDKFRVKMPFKWWEWVEWIHEWCNAPAMVLHLLKWHLGVGLAYVSFLPEAEVQIYKKKFSSPKIIQFRNPKLDHDKKAYRKVREIRSPGKKSATGRTQKFLTMESSGTNSHWFWSKSWWKTASAIESTIHKLPDNWTNVARVSTTKDIVTCPDSKKTVSCYSIIQGDWAMSCIWTEPRINIGG